MLSDWEEAEVVADLESVLDQRATVYGADADTDQYTVLLRSQLPCRLQPLTAGVRFAPTSADRAESMAFRYFFWPRGIRLTPAPLPQEQCQIQIDGIRYQPEPGTFQELRAGASGVLNQRCSVLRQQTVSY